MIKLDIFPTLYITITTIVEDIGLAWQPKHRKFNNSTGQWATAMIVVPSLDQNNKVIALCKLFLRLQTLKPSQVPKDIDTQVIPLNECDDVLW